MLEKVWFWGHGILQSEYKKNQLRLGYKLFPIYCELFQITIKELKWLIINWIFHLDGRSTM
jgi:hypothetical protein